VVGEEHDHASDAELGQTANEFGTARAESREFDSSSVRTVGSRSSGRRGDRAMNRIDTASLLMYSRKILGFGSGARRLGSTTVKTSDERGDLRARGGG
jgi:hypothetical protein